MIQIREKTDSRIKIHMDLEEPIYRFVNIILSMMQKGYTISYDPNSSLIIQFDKTQSSPVRYLNISRYSKESNITFISMTENYYRTMIKCYGSITKSSIDNLFKQNYLEPFCKYLPTKFFLNKQTIKESSTTIPRIRFKLNIQASQLKRQEYIDKIVADFKNVEENEHLTNFLLQICFLNFYYDNTINLSTISRLIRNMDIVYENPTQSARTRFINICETYLQSKIRNPIKFKNFLIINKNHYDNVLNIIFVGLLLFSSGHLSKYKYLDEPAINFISMLLERNNLLEALELSVSKEIILNS